MTVIDKIEAFFNMPFELLSLFASLILIPSLGFILVNFYTRLKEKLQIRAKLRNTKSYILFWLDRILISLKKRLEYLEQFQSEFSAMNGFEFVPNHRVNLHIDKIKLITSLDIYSTLVKNIKGDTEKIKKNYFYFLNSLDFLETKLDELDSFLSSTGKKTADQLGQMGRCFQAINEERVRYLQSNYSNVRMDPFLNSFYEHHELNHSSSTVGITELREKYIVPLNDICTSALLENPEDTRVPSVQRKTSEFLATHDFFLNEKERLSTYISESVKSLVKSKDRLDQFKAFHTSSKFKGLFHLI